MKLEPFVLQKKTLGQILDETVAKYPDNDAFIYADRDLRQTWSQFSDDVDSLAKGLMALGIQKGEIVAVWATNVPHWVTLMLATARIGAVLLTVNTSYRENELAYLIRHSGCENFFLAEGFRDNDFIQTLYGVIPELRTQKREDFHSPDFPNLKRVMLFGSEPHRAMHTIVEIMELGNTVSAADYEARKASIHPDDIVNMQYTSGTTGFPKGVKLSHVNIGNNGYWIGRLQNFTAADRLCLPVPLFHCFGCVLGIMSVLNHGTATIILDTFNPVQALTAVEAERCTALYGVPSMFLSILEHRVFPKFDLSSLRTGIMAGSVCPEPLLRRVIDQMNMKEITSVYGLTETSPGMTQTHADEEFYRRVTSVGRALPGIDVQIIDPETCEILPRGTIGEVACKGYNVMKGYHNMPEETLAVTRGGWLHSGDLGFMDEEGYVVITGRIKDMIIRAGENIYPREIEEFLMGMEGISDIQIVAVPSRRYGEEVGAFIILKPDVTLKPEDIREFCRGRIAWHKVPRYVAFVDAYPLTGSGKIQKYKLREMAAELFPEAMKEGRGRSMEAEE